MPVLPEKVLCYLFLFICCRQKMSFIYDRTKSDVLLEAGLIIAYMFQIVWHILMDFEEYIIVLFTINMLSCTIQNGDLWNQELLRGSPSFMSYPGWKQLVSWLYHLLIHDSWTTQAKPNGCPNCESPFYRSVKVWFVFWKQFKCLAWTGFSSYD